MSLSEFITERVLPRLSLEDIYSDPSHRFKVSGNKAKGGCPFHKSKSGTSFTVDRDTFHWYCAGCHKGGDAITYLHSLKCGYISNPSGVDFTAVVQELADMAGVALLAREINPQAQAKIDQLRERSAILEATQIYLREQLVANPAAADFLSKSKGHTLDVLNNVGVGFYDSTERLEAYLLEQGFSKTAIKQTGILRPWHEGYISFPWCNYRGELINIYFRTKDKQPSPGKPKNYSLPGDGVKSSPLFADRAYANRHTHWIVVEGLTDATLLQGLGVTNVVSPVTCNLSDSHIDVLKKCKVDTVTLCLDPDPAGAEGTKKAVVKLLNQGIKPFVATLPAGFDSDDFVVQHGLDAWQKLIEQADHGLRWVAKQLIFQFSLSNDKERAALLREADRFVNQMNQMNHYPKVS